MRLVAIVDIVPAQARGGRGVRAAVHRRRACQRCRGTAAAAGCASRSRSSTRRRWASTSWSRREHDLVCRPAWNKAISARPPRRPDERRGRPGRWPPLAHEAAKKAWSTMTWATRARRAAADDRGDRALGVRHHGGRQHQGLSSTAAPRRPACSRKRAWN
ncbi:MAG: hypothetical protein U0470_01690 [Anaerolineae bacterium]